MANRNSKYSDLMKAFGKAVRHYRNRLGFSQEALADRAQLDRSYMSQIERGIKNATLNSIWRISQALEVVPSQILKLTEQIALDGPAGGEARVPPEASEESRGPTILVVDDDPDVCQALRSLLGDAGFRTREATCGFDAFWMVATDSIGMVIADVRMANGTGVELLGAMKKHYPKIPVLLVSGYDDLSDADARRLGARALLSKPFDTSAFVRTIREATSH